MNNTPTPETDAARHDLSDYGSPVPCSWGDWIHADVASKLERERDEALSDLEFRRGLYKVLEEANNRLIAANEEAVELARTLKQERDEARNKMADALQEVDLRTLDFERMKEERDEARAALKPFSEFYLWPDDAGEWTANDVRSDEDWDEERNDANVDDVFIKRAHIRAARKALEGWQ